MSLLAFAGAGAAVGGTLSRLLSIVSKVDKNVQAVKQATKPTSLIKLTSGSRVEPLCMVDSDCIHLEYLPDVLNSLQAIFTGYYLQAVAMMGTVSGARVAEFLDPLNPNRDPSVQQFLKATADTLGVSLAMHQEAYKWRLPTSVSVEAAPSVKPLSSGTSVDDKVFMSLQEKANLSIGKIVNVTVSVNNQKITMPIAIRLMVNELTPTAIINILGDDAMDKSFVERYYKWKSGRISLVNDLILAKDLIREHKKKAMADTEGSFSEIYNRATKNTIAGIVSKRPSAAASSNLYVISENTARMLKARSRIDIENFSQRQAMFEQTYAMIMVVIDREYQRINFYHDGIRRPTSLGLRDIKTASKGDGPSIMDIFNALRQGQSPSF